MIAWIANICAVYSMWAVGGKLRHGFITGAAGCVLWTAEGVRLNHGALITIEVLLLILYIRGWILWRPDDKL